MTRLRDPGTAWPPLVVAVAALACACSGTRTDPATGDATPATTAPRPPSAPADPVGAEAAAHKADAVMTLPQVVGAWKRPDVPRTVTARDIFEYMDGAGELYLAYRFDHLDVYNYASASQGNILVEFYWMKTPDDAFGLLSNDWGGEPVGLTAEWAQAPRAPTVPPHRALYGAGLLRIWSHRLYVRVLASQETPASRQAVVDIGRAAVAGQRVAAPPAIVGALPIRATPRLNLRPNRVWFVRSYLVLNSAFFLATQNVLNLDLSTEVAVGPYGSNPPVPGWRPAQLILIRYASADEARRALRNFREVYLPESLKGTATSGLDQAAFARIEGGWIGYRVSGRALALACECPSREQARVLLAEAVRNLEKLEESGDG